jgi:CarD family transcriptional regulator
MSRLVLLLVNRTVSHPKLPDPCQLQAGVVKHDRKRTEGGLAPLRPFVPVSRAHVRGSQMSKSKKNEFRPDDFVVYPAHGVGRIVSIEEQEVAGLRLEMFVISFDKDKMTLRVPTARASEIGMRSLSTPDLIDRALETLKGKARVKRAMWSRRAQEYEQKIHSGDLLSIAEVVRDLHRCDDQREQSYSERQLYEAALDRLTREVAAVGGLDEGGAQKRVGEVLLTRAA